jgi:hypothetical protein
MGPNVYIFELKKIARVRVLETNDEQVWAKSKGLVTWFNRVYSLVL